MKKILSLITVKRFLVFSFINLIIYLTVCFVLIYLPIPTKKVIENYDYSSIKKKTNEKISSEQRNIKAKDGFEIFSRIYQSKSKDVLILIHGSGSEGRYLRYLARSLADSNVATVITPDLRGHGENKGEKGDIEYIGQLESDIEDLIAYSKTQLGAKKIILAGHSSGGGLVLRFIGNPQNTKVDKAIMLAPYLGHEAITTKPNSGNWVTVAIKRWVGISMINRFGITKFDGLPVLFFNRPEAINDKLQVPAYSYRMAVNFAPKNYKEDIANIKIPCLVLVGGKDESFYPEKFKVAFKPVEKCVKTVVLDDANHLNIVRNQETFDQIINWMKDEKSSK
jgi:non-heme chloroperoxidase